MRCLTSKELSELKKLEVFTSPYSQDLVSMVKEEIVSAKKLEKRKKKSKKTRRINEKPVNITEEMRKMAFILGIYGG